MASSQLFIDVFVFVNEVHISVCYDSEINFATLIINLCCGNLRPIILHHLDISIPKSFLHETKHRPLVTFNYN